MNYKLKNNKRNHSFEYIFFLKKTSEISSWNQDPESDPDPLFMIRNDTNPQH